MRYIPRKRVVIAAVGVIYAVCAVIAKEPDEDSEDDPTKLRDDPATWIREVAHDIILLSYVVAIFVPAVVLDWLEQRNKKQKNLHFRCTTPPSDLYERIGGAS